MTWGDFAPYRFLFPAGRVKSNLGAQDQNARDLAVSVRPRSRDLNTVYFERTRQRENLLFATNSTAPTKSATAPPSNCWRVAPASINSDTIIASSGTSGPNGMMKVAG
jgi:hypothetical protein